MTEITTEAATPSYMVRAHRFPVLEAGNLAFPDGRYIVNFEPGKDRCSFHLNHRIEGAPLISELLESGDARYLCAISSPKSSYRQTLISSAASHKVSWDVEELGESPLFTPMIVMHESRKVPLDCKQHGVHRIWQGRTVEFEKGVRLAVGDVVHLVSSFQALLSLHSDESLDEGTFYVEVQSEPFQFEVHLSPGFYRFLLGTEERNRHRDVMTHIVTACLALLQRDFSNRSDDDEDDGWSTHRNLVHFADLLESYGLPHWTDDEFQPELVATKLYPWIPPEMENEDEE